ncbi:hypothetical protein [Actinoplanes palleronii]|uniref:hypothetical protein n=1 Tax=Actinoplanes palleronii TaxID=113570 RepID=UPI0019430B78|nr:hypothetical protein [Actinoplanes palleronii]
MTILAEIALASGVDRVGVLPANDPRTAIGPSQRAESGGSWGTSARKKLSSRP